MFGSDGSPIIQYVVIFAVIFTALAAIVFVVRRLTGRGLALPGRGGARGRQPRLGIVDVYELDRARQLILLRRDNVEHLLLVGGPNDVVVERNIQRGQRPLPEAALRPAEAMAEPLPDPLAEAGQLPEPQRALPEVVAHRAEPAFEPPFDPGFAMPVVVRPPVPGSGAAPPVTLPLDAALIGGDEPGQDIPAERRPPAPDRVPAPGPNERAPREPFSPRRILQRTAPPLADPGPGPASARRGDETGRPDAAEPRLPPLAASGERRPVDPAVLSDMARQLQEALARPASAVAPAPSVAEAPPAVDPVAAAMASAPAVPVQVPPAVPPPAVPPPASEPAPPPPIPVPQPRPAPVPPAPVPPAPPAAQELPRPVPPQIPAQAPVPPPAPKMPAPKPPAPKMPAPEPAAAERPAPPPEPAPSQKGAGNPFSVEEIEAEFARLLGRPLDRRG